MPQMELICAEGPVCGTGAGVVAGGGGTGGGVLEIFRILKLKLHKKEIEQI
jgi:hypothetical protein